MKNNKIVVDLNKCQYAWRSWVTLCGNYKRSSKPTEPTVHGQEFDCDAPAFGSIEFTMADFIVPKTITMPTTETLYQRAKRRKLLDTWIPCVTLQVTANHRLTYTGDKAESIWKAWCEKQFNKKGK
jgi:hypothetical protein